MDFWRLVNPDRFSVASLPGEHQHLLCAGAVLLAILAAWVLLPVIDRYRASTGAAQRVWLVMGSAVMGIGVWAMHFTAMLAFTLPVPIAYDGLITAISIAPVAIGAGIAVRSIARHRNSLWRLNAASLSLALGIGGMHYIGMEALIVPVSMYYVPSLFALSIVAAYALAIAGLLTYLRMIESRRLWFGRLSGSVILGAAVSSMHFIAMRATYFQPNADTALQLEQSRPVGLIGSVFIGAAILLALLALISIVDRRFGEVRRSLRASEQRFQRLAETTPTAIFTFDQHRVRYANPALTRMTGYGIEDLTSMPLEELFGEPFAALANKLLNDGRRDYDTGNHQFQFDHADGARRWLGVSLTLTELDEGRIVGLGSALDLTEQKKVEQEMERLAFTDPLTGLANRALFMDRLQHVIDRKSRTDAAPASVMLLDFDNFKLINDAHGHLVGDSILEEIAQRLRAILRRQDTVARIGGDEFAVLLEDFDDDHDEVAVANRMLRDVSQPISIDGRNLEVHTSIGVARLNAGHMTPDQVLNDADVALYRAKETRGCWVAYDEALDAAAKRERLLIMELKEAIENDALELYYQPIVAADGTTICGFEALVRWRRSHSEWVSPSEFIPLAESCGLIADVDVWVVQTACAALAQFIRKCEWTDGYLSINISAESFRDDRLYDVIAGCVREYGFAPGRIKLELTERMLFDNSGTLHERLRQLIGIGCEFMIDDFGTGYSSLSYLHRFPISTVKIDRTFVANIDIDDSALPIIRMIRALARTLNMGVIAEGVETRVQYEKLTALGINQLQGYLFGRPVRAVDIVPLIRRSRFREFAERSGVLRFITQRDKRVSGA